LQKHIIYYISEGRRAIILCIILHLSVDTRSFLHVKPILLFLERKKVLPNDPWTVVVSSIQYEHGFVIKTTRSLDEAKRSVATIMTDGTQYWRQRCVVPANISETATMPKTDKTENYSCDGRRDGTNMVGRKEIYYVHGVWWCLEIFRRLDIGRRPLLLLYLQPTHRSIYLILLYV